MSEFYDNLLRATDNLQDITFTKYATITNIQNELYDVKEEESNLEHTNVPSLNGLHLKKGDKVILGFINNNLYNPVILGEIGNNDIYSKEEVDEKIQEVISGQIDLSAYMKWTDYTSDLGNQTDSSEFLKALDNTILAITGRGDL